MSRRGKRKYGRKVFLCPFDEKPCNKQFILDGPPCGGAYDFGFFTNTEKEETIVSPCERLPYSEELKHE